MGKGKRTKAGRIKRTAGKVAKAAVAVASTGIAGPQAAIASVALRKIASPVAGQRDARRELEAVKLEHLRESVDMSERIRELRVAQGLLEEIKDQAQRDARQAQDHVVELRATVERLIVSRDAWKALAKSRE